MEGPIMTEVIDEDIQVRISGICAESSPTNAGGTGEESDEIQVTTPPLLASPKTSASEYPYNSRTPSNDKEVVDQELEIRYPRGITLNWCAEFDEIQPDFNFPEIQGKYKVLEKIGEGTFSSVYRAASLKDGKEVALKRIYPTCSPARILHEMQFLRKLGGHAHVISLIGGMRLKDQVTLVLPYCPHDKFKDYLPHMTVSQIRDYMKALFEALAHMHSQKIIHRDVKPGNFLYHIKSNSFMLVDFGLAQEQSDFESEGASSNNNNSISHPTSLKRKRSDGIQEQTLQEAAKRVKVPQGTYVRKNTIELQGTGAKHSMRAPRGGTRGFRAPEVLMKSQQQSVAIDIWSAGVVLLCILSTRYPFFTAPDDLVSLVEIAALLGTKELKTVAALLNRKIEFPRESFRLPLKYVCTRLSCRSIPIPDSAFDLLEKCLDVNPFTRISASEALKHPFFSEE